MIICVTAQGNNLEAMIDPKFGRCSYFIIIETETMEFEAIDNSHIALSGGAGIQSGQLINEKNVKTLLTGQVGPNAFKTLKTAGIKIITDISGQVNDVIAKFSNGDYEMASEPSLNSHFGITDPK